jgi:hypothetical protein
VIIEARFNGPPESGNGGYTAGLIASALGGDRSGYAVMLRTPPPLSTPLRVVGEVAGTVYAGDRVIAEVEPAGAAGEPAAPVGYEEAVAASFAYPGFDHHPFPTCFVCGPQRAVGDGLRIFPGPTSVGHTAAPWSVPEDVSPAIMWAALDCPGGWAVIAPGSTYVLGRIAATVLDVPAPGDRCVIVGELVSAAGRKAQVRTAVYIEEHLLAHADATWIALE